MLKIFIPVFLVVITIISVSIFFNSGQVENKEEEIKSDAFNKNKEKVLVQPISWANGSGVELGSVVAPSYVVIDKNGDVVYSLNPDKRRSPASLTKLMTAMVVLDLAKISDLLTVHHEATLLEPTVLHIKEGEQFTVEELLSTLLIYSANDSAEVLAEQIGRGLGGDRQTFIDLMNEKAKRLNLSQTQFTNPSGFDDPGQYSTARDISIITQYALTKYPDIAKIVKIKDLTLPENSYHGKYNIVNWNSLIDIYPGMIGGKIGHTDEAGHSTVVVSERENERMMSVLIGAPDRRARDLWTVELLNSAFEQKGISRYKVTRDMLIARSYEWSKILYEESQE